MDDIRLAHKITLHYARDIYGLTEDDLKGLSVKNNQHHVLLDSLGRGADGFISPEERGELRSHGFSDQLINELAGDDGKKALEARIKWLSKNAPQKIFGKNEKIRGEIIQELGDMGVLATGAVPVLIEILGSKLKEKTRLTQLASAVALGKIGDVRAVGPLANAFKTWPPETLNAVGTALVALSKNFVSADLQLQIVSALMVPLTHSEFWLGRYEAAKALGNLGPHAVSATDSLVHALRDQEWWVRQEAAYALGKIQSESPEVIAALITAIREWPSEERRVAVEALVAIGSPALPALSQLLDQKGEAPYVRQSAIKIMARSEDPLDETTIKKMIMALKDPDPQVQKEAEEALIHLGAQAFPHLVEALGSVDVKFREQVMRIIRTQAEKGLVEAVSQLIELLETHPGRGVREEAALLLGELGIREAIDLIVLAMKKGEIDSSIAGKALQLLVPESVPPIVDLLKDKTGRDPATQILLMLGDSAIDHLVGALIAGDAVEKDLYADVLILFGEGALSQVLSLATHSDPEVHGRGVKILVSLQASASLLLLLNDQQWHDYHPSYASALVAIGLPAAPLLLQTLADPSQSQIHSYLVDVLVAMGEPAVPLLEESVGDYNESISQHAREALSRMTGENHGP